MMKKILGLLVISFMLFFVSDEVKADILDVNDVVSEFSETEIIKLISAGETIFNTELDTINNILNIYGDNEKIVSLSFNDEYIEYNDINFSLTPDNYVQKINESLMIYCVLEAVIRASGYDNMMFDYEQPNVDAYDTYGLMLESEYYSFEGSDDGVSYEISGDFVKYFKVSLDTDKIDKLVEEHGVDINDENFSNEELSGLKPELTFSDVTDTSVTLYASVPDVNINSDLDLSCYIYRSDSEFGEYEKISDFAVSCLGLVGYIDEDLKSDTTYYYKAMVMGGDTYSDVISVTTNKFPFVGSVGADLDDQIGENPKTDSLPIVRLILLLIVNAAIVLIIKKRFLNTYYS